MSVGRSCGVLIASDAVAEGLGLLATSARPILAHKHRCSFYVRRSILLHRTAVLYAVRRVQRSVYSPLNYGIYICILVDHTLTVIYLLYTWAYVRLQAYPFFL